MEIRPVTLVGRGIILEPLSIEHLDQLCAVGLDPALWQLTTSSVGSRDEMRAYIEAALQLQADGTALPFATVERVSRTAIGSTRFGNIDRSNQRLEIGWTWLGREWQRTCANTETKYLMLKHAFETLCCVRVEFKTDVLNERSRKALLRIGAKEEGVLRKHMVTHSGRMRDTVYYSILDSEWTTVKFALETKLEEGFQAGDQALHMNMRGGPHRF